jgi:hypothetical protein
MTTSSLSGGVLDDQRRQETYAGDAGTDTDIQRIREGLEEHLRVNFTETGLLSRQEAESQRRYVEEAIHDRAKIAVLLEDYASSDARVRLEANRKLYYSNFIGKLDEALEANVISSKSYDEWVEWVKDENRKGSESTRSIRETLPKYLDERWELARERQNILKDPRIKAVTDPRLKAEIGFLEKDSEYFGTLNFTQRKNLVGRVAAGLAVMEGGEGYEKLRAQAEKILKDATALPQPALHRDKVGTWLKRIFESGASPEEIKAFLDGSGAGSLQKLIGTWRSVAIQFWTLRKDPAFAGVRSTFVDTKAFLWMHFDERVKYLEKMRAEREEASALKAQARSLITRGAGALDEAGKERWLHQYVFNGKYTLSQLRSIIATNLSSRLEGKVEVLHRFEKASETAKTMKGIRGMHLPEKSAFLKLHYDKQLATVKEMELRLEHIRTKRPDFLLIRHFMDREDYDGAEELITEARKKSPGLSLEDDAQLLSMERYIALHKPHGAKGKEREKNTISEAEKIDHLIDDIGSESLKYLCKNLCNRGSESINALGWSSYNRDWCYKHGYLNPRREEQAIHKGKAAALSKERRRKRGVVAETIQGETAQEEYIELSRSSATNVCVDISDSGAMVALAETLHRKRKDHRALYWTNAIFHRGGTLMDIGEQREETRKMYQMRNLLRKLEAKNVIYHYKETATDKSQKMAMKSPGSVAKVSKSH